MAQVKNAADIAEFKYGSNRYTIMIVDQSSCHHNFDVLPLIAKNTLVKDGGSRRVRDRVWAQRPQSMMAQPRIHGRFEYSLKSLLIQRVLVCLKVFFCFCI